MNSLMKKIVFVIAFVLLTLILPGVLLLLFVDASQNFSVFVIAYGVIIFAILGYIVASIRSMDKKIEETMEEIKMQNAAIAYKLTNVDNESIQAPIQQPVVNIPEEKVVNTANIPLNPAEPLVIPAEKKVTAKVTDDGFDDFK